MNAFLHFLRERIRQVREAEETALALLHEQGDETGYRDNMRRKAELLAHLASDADSFLDEVGPTTRPLIEHRLGMFAQSARRSLDIGSVFYMSALLYPEDHRPGQPNALETWLNDLERGK